MSERREELNEEKYFKDTEMSFWDHMAELAMRLRRIVIVTLILTVIYLILPSQFDINSLTIVLTGKWTLHKPLVGGILDKIKHDLLPSKAILISHQFANPLVIYLEAGILLAIITASPYIGYEVYMFVAPGLYPHEKKFLKRFVFAFTGLFILGVIYGYYLIMPITFKILVYFSDILGAQPLFDINDFYTLTFVGLAVCGFFFTMPVFLILAVKFGVLEVDVLVKNKRYIYVAVFIITAIITPDPTPVSMLLLSIPFIILYEFSIWIGKRVAPKETFETTSS